VASSRHSAGLLLHRATGAAGLEVLLGHMGGPFWARRDEAAWSIFKGEYAHGEDPLAAARREFQEETGLQVPAGPPIPLGEVRQSGGKRVVAWALAADVDPTTIVSNTFTIEWPPRSGRQATFPEIDRAAWFDVATARTKLVRGQVPLLDALLAAVAAGAG
jgi:predicted NUDIX family NTP pyrophosphohydrolase